MTERDFGREEQQIRSTKSEYPKQIQNANVRMFKTAIVILL